jgi:Leucine-rich repeat (LRR) protein
MKQSYSSDSSGMAVCSINAKLISEVTGVSSSDFSRVQILDLHLKDDDNNKRGKIRKIENIGFLTPNISQLNLSYNIIVQMEGFGRLHHLVELNLAENAIRKIENIEGTSWTW